MSIPTLKPVEKAFVPDHRHSYRADRIRELSKTTVESVMEIGELLVQAKSMIPHGAWSEWLEDEFGWSERTAERYMRLHESYKSDTVSDLPIDLSALYLLCKRTTERKVREEALRQARAGQHVTKSSAERLIEWSKRPLPPPPKRSKEQVRAELTALVGNKVVHAIAELHVALDIRSKDDVSIDKIAEWIAASEDAACVPKMLAALPSQIEGLARSLKTLTNVVRFQHGRKRVQRKAVDCGPLGRTGI